MQRPQSIQRIKSNFSAQVSRNASGVELEMKSPESTRASSPAKPPRSRSDRRAAAPPPPPPPPPTETVDGGPSPSRREKSDRPVSMARASSSRVSGGGSKSPERAQAAPDKVATTVSNPSPDRAVFVGKNPLQYILWGHYMAYCAAVLGILLGIFEVSYHWADSWQCRIEGQEIHSTYIMDAFGTCPTFYGSKEICCDSTNTSHFINGNYYLGLFYIFASVITIIINDPVFGCSLWFPNDTWGYQNGFSGLGLYYFIVGVVGCASYTLCLAGFSFLSASAAYIYGRYRQECGDGGYFETQDNIKKKQAAAQKILDAKSPSERKEEEHAASCLGTMERCVSFSSTWTCAGMWESISDFFSGAYNRDHLSTYFWVTLYIIGNVFYFMQTVDVWYGNILKMQRGLKDGTLDVSCGDELCVLNRLAIQFGPVSTMIPYAKGAGKCLNLNCSMILYPVTKILLNKLNNIGIGFSKKVKRNSLFAKFFAHPISRYIPLQKNIEFHKFVGYLVLLFTLIHVFFHLVNLQYASTGTLRRVALWGSVWTYPLTGAIITWFMVLMYASAVPEQVRRIKFEIFFNSHQLYMGFIALLFIHGHVFWMWAVLPCFLLCIEKYLEHHRGDVTFAVTKVEWIPPVMAIYFKPKNKEDFVFKEGQYLSMNCPYVSEKEWHPFTISSAYDDLQNGPRINLETGEDVMLVPRPAGRTGRWNKYCDVSKDYRYLEEHELLDKSDTGYNDYISIHVKVHGLEDPVARSWTRRLKEYFEMMAPGRSFPFYFTHRDHRGDIVLGREKGPDGIMPIIRIDGPHAAPAEHYSSYGTVMLVGAGIGLTPCASILTALTR